MSLVLTGAAGWLGMNVLDQLAASRYSLAVHVLARDASDVRRVSSLGASLDLRVTIGDLLDPLSVRRLFSDAEGAAVIHCAGVIHPRRADDFHRVNVLGTQAVLKAAEAHGVSRFVHISSNSPFGVNAGADDFFRPQEPYRPYLGYGSSKMHAEMVVKGSGVEWVVLRPLWFYGPFQPARQTQFFSLVRRGRFPVFGQGTNRRTLTYVPELARASIRAAFREVPESTAWWVGDLYPYSMDEIVDAVKQALMLEGLEISERGLKVPTVVSALAERGDSMIQRLGRYNAQLHVLGELRHTIAADTTGARLALGLTVRSDLVGGMRSSIAWCRSMGMVL